MAVRKPLVHVSGRTKQLPATDSIAVPWSWLTEKPTTLAGYGITDAVSFSNNPLYYNGTGSIIDCNDLPIGSRAMVATSGSNANYPVTSGVSFWHIETVNSYVGETTKIQRAWSYDAPNAVAMRSLQTGIWTAWTYEWNSGNHGAGSGLDADLLDGQQRSQTNVAGTVPSRDNNGDIHVRLLRSEFGDQGTISGAIAYRVNNSTDNYIRFCSNPAAVRTWLGVGAQGFGDIPTATTSATFDGNVGGAFYRATNTSTGFPAVSYYAATYLPYDGGNGVHIVSPVLANELYFKRTNTASWFKVWHDGNFDPATKLDTSGGSVTGAVAFNPSGATGGVSFGAVVASSATADLSKHIALFGSSYGFNITASRLNYVAPTGAAHEFYVGATAAMRLDDQNLILNGKVALRSNDAWLRLNPNGDFAGGIYCGTGLFRTDGTLQVGTTSANGFYCTPSIPPKWKDIELGYRKVPQTITNANYTFVADDSGKARGKNNSTAYAYTVNNSVHEAGDVLTVYNHATSGNITITAGAGVTLRLAGTATTGNRTVVPGGIATIFFVSASYAYVSGPGVS